MLAPGAAVASMAVLAQPAAAQRAAPGHGGPPRPGGGVRRRGGGDAGACAIPPPRRVGGEARQSDGEPVGHGRSGHARGTPCAVGFGGDRGAQGGQGSRAVRVRHVREAGGAVGGQRPTAPEPVTGGAPRGGRDGGRREPTAAEPGRKRVRVDRGRCGCAAMEGRHGASRTADTRATVVGTQGGQPVPGAPTRDGAHPPLSRRSHGFEEGSRVGLQMARHEALAALVEDADVHHTGVQGAAAVQGVRGGGKSPCGLLLVPHRVLPTLSRPRWSAGEGASISIKGLEPTAYSLRFASASGSGSGLAFGFRTAAGTHTGRRA